MLRRCNGFARHLQLLGGLISDLGTTELRNLMDMQNSRLSKAFIHTESKLDGMPRFLVKNLNYLPSKV